MRCAECNKRTTAHNPLDLCARCWQATIDKLTARVMERLDRSAARR